MVTEVLGPSQRSEKSSRIARRVTRMTTKAISSHFSDDTDASGPAGCVRAYQRAMASVPQPIISVDTKVESG